MDSEQAGQKVTGDEYGHAQMAKKQTLTPTEEQMREIDKQMTWLEERIHALAQKLQPALSPGYHGDGEANGNLEQPDQEQSRLVEQLKIYSLTLARMSNDLMILERRVEL